MTDHQRGTNGKGSRLMDETTPNAQRNEPRDDAYASTFLVPKMDCPAEENLIRMAEKSGKILQE